MEQVSTIGLDIAKSVFQVHGVDAAGEVVVSKQLRRRQVIPFFEKRPACLIGMEACATSHHWARELGVLGHEVRIMPAGYVKPYVKRNKNDAADAAAICEAVTRPTMRFVAVKSRAQQSLLMVHRSRALLVRQRTMLVNAIRAHLAEFGIVAPVGLRGLKALLAVISDAQDARLPSLARSCERGEPAAGKHSRHRTDYRNRPHRVGGRSFDLQVRPRDGRLDRSGAQTELNRWQAASRADLQTG